MNSQHIDAIKSLFQSRLATLEHLLTLAQAHFQNDESFLQQRLAADMFPFGTQIVFTCNQPRNFVLWCEGKPADNLDPQVTSIAQASEHIKNTRELLVSLSLDDEKLAEHTQIELGQNLYLELSGHDYVNEFLIPNFYFHLVTAYDILRMAGVTIGKRDYMMHMGPFVRTR